jgi:Cd2+/Zn2+-exporting ATPase
VDGTTYHVGNDKLMRQIGVEVPEVEPVGTVVYTAADGRCLGYLLIMDEEKEDAKACISGLKKSGVKRIVMLTGDRKAAAAHVADSLGLTEY